MYRMQQEEILAENSQNLENRVEFLSRVSSLPAVNLALNYAVDTYAKTKERNALFKYTLGTAEKSLFVVAKTAEPIVNKFQTPVKIVDGFACKGLDKLEEKAPFIKNTPEEMVENTKSYYQGKIEESFNRYNEAKNYRKEQFVNAANALLESPYGQYVSKKVDDSLTYTDNYVDYLLPASNESDEQEEVAKNPIQRASVISKKVYHRLHKKACLQMDQFQKNARNTFAQLNVAVVMLEKLRNSSNEKVNDTYVAAQAQIQEIWTELMKEDNETIVDKKNLNEKLFYITRRITQKLVTTFNTALTVYQTAPAALTEKIQQSQNYAQEMYTSFLKTEKVEELNTQVMETLRPKIQYLQDSLVKISNYQFMNQALQLLNKTSVRKSEDMHADDSDDDGNKSDNSQSTENSTAENNATENATAENDSTESSAAENDSTENSTAENNSTEL